MWTIPLSWIFILLCLAVPVMGGGASISRSAAAAKFLPRGGAAKKVDAGPSGPVQVFVKTVMDARRHLVAAAGKQASCGWVGMAWLV